jgi:hypothetical protein
MVHFPLSPSPVTGRKPAVAQPFPTPGQQVALATDLKAGWLWQTGG